MSDDDPTSETRIRDVKPLERVAVRVVEGKGRGRSAVLLPDQSVSVGKSPDNQLQLDDVTVSRYHVDLTLRGDVIEVRDLESMNGTYVGDMRVIRASVRPGAKITVGSNWISLTEEAAVETRDVAPVELPELAGVVAHSTVMGRVLRTIYRLATSNLIVLLHGEPGTGKELLARVMHDLSEARERPFEMVDCSSLAPAMIASELFGHERDAFSGADFAYAGAFERAHGGTVFLKHVGELPMVLQPLLLDSLQRRRFKRLGAAGDRRVNVRVIAATHRDLRVATNLGTFRADLYFRLAAARVVIPPLRQRREDIAPLVRYFAATLTGDPSLQPFDRNTLAVLEAQPWSGNVRELRTVVESAVGASAQLRADESNSARVTFEVQAGDPLALPYREARARALSDFERSYLRDLMATCGSASEAARRAGVDRARFVRLLRKHGLR